MHLLGVTALYNRKWNCKIFFDGSISVQLSYVIIIKKFKNMCYQIPQLKSSLTDLKMIHFCHCCSSL